MNEPYQTRVATRGEVDIAVAWAKAEGWNPGPGDADAFYAADPGGFFVGVLDGKIIATISAVRTGERFAFVGFYIVEQAYRGRGFGLRLWRHAMAGVGGRVVGLDGVLARVSDYEKSGFKLAYQNHRHRGLVGRCALGERDVAGATFERATGVTEEMAAYDSRAYGVRRGPFLERWVGMHGAVAWGAKRNGVWGGWGMARPCAEGWKIGPLFADTEAIAAALFHRLCGSVAKRDAGASVYLDAPGPNGAAVALAKRHGMEEVFATARMYAGGKWELPVERIFGVTSFELG